MSCKDLGPKAEESVKAQLSFFDVGSLEDRQSSVPPLDEKISEYLRTTGQKFIGLKSDRELSFAELSEIWQKKRRKQQDFFSKHTIPTSKYVYASSSVSGFVRDNQRLYNMASRMNAAGISLLGQAVQLSEEELRYFADGDRKSVGEFVWLVRNKTGLMFFAELPGWYIPLAKRNASAL